MDKTLWLTFLGHPVNCYQTRRMQAQSVND